MSNSTDVFLSHNSKDKPAVREIARALESAGLDVWLDEWDLTPGRPWQEELEQGLGTAKSIAVFVGANGIQRWVEPEMRAALSESVDRGVSVIPVLLPGGPEPNTLPTFLKAYTWVDMRTGVTEPTLYRLQCGIRGIAPRVGRTRLGDAIITGEGDLVVVQSCHTRSQAENFAGMDQGSFNPYKGLLAFHEEDADRFFGREEQVARLWDLFRDQHEPPGYGETPFRLLPVLGPSGSGKSSVVRAGLIPELARRPLPGWKDARVVVLTPGSHPLESLAALLARMATNSPAPVATTREFRDEMTRPNEEGTFDGLRRIANALPGIASSPLIVLVDQFEEVYSLCRDDSEREAFIGNVLHAVTDTAANVSAIITLRTDFLDETQKHAWLNGAIARQGVIIPGMNEDELRRAITQPAVRAGHPLDDATVELLINETKDREGALPLLQFTLQRIWDGMADGLTPSETLKKIGGVGGALAGEAQRIYESLPEVDKKIARRVFLGLIQLGEGTRDTRRRAVVTSLITLADEPERVEEVVRRFSSQGVRLITLSATPDGNEFAEVTHEALFEHWRQLDEWLEASRDDLRFQRRLDQAARHWENNDHAEGLLWRPPDLDLLRAFQERSSLEMTPIHLDFFIASERSERERILEKKRQERRLRDYLYAASAAAVIATILGFIAFGMFVRAQHARADAETLAKEKTQLAKDELRARQRAVQLAKAERGLRQAAEWKTAETIFEQSHAKTVQQGPREGVLSLAESLQTATDVGHEKLADHIRMQIAAWTDSIHSLRSIITVGAPVRSLAISPDGRVAVIGGADATVRLWDISSKTFLGNPLQCDASVATLAFSPDNKTVATGSRSGKITIWETETGKEIGEAFNLDESVLSMVFSPDGRLFFAGGEEGTGMLWDFERRTQVGDPLIFDSAVNAAAINPERHLLVGTRAGTCELWDLDEQQRVGVVARAEAEIWAVVFSSDNKTALIGSGDGRMARRILPTPSVASASRVRCITVAYSSRRYDDRLQVQRHLSSQANQTRYAAVLQEAGPPVSRQGISSMAVSPDESTYMVGREDGRVSIHSTSTGEAIGASMLHLGPVSAVAFTPDGTACISGSGDGSARVWDVKTPQLLGVPLRHGSTVHAIAISPDNETIATSGEDGTVKFWNAVEQRETRSPLSHKSAVFSVTFSPDGNQIAAGCDNGIARVWSLTPEPVARDFVHDDSVNAVAFSPDGRFLLTGCDDNHAYLWDVEIGTKRASKLKHEDEVLAVAYSPSGRVLATGSKDHEVKLWNLESGEMLFSPLAHNDWVFSVAFSPEGNMLVTGSADNLARLWDVKTGEPVGRPLPHGDDVRAATFSRDGRYVVTTSVDETVQIWDVMTGKPVGQPLPHDQGVGAVAVSNNNRWLVTGSADGTARLRRFPVPDTDTVERIKLRSEVITGLTLGDDQSIQPLDAEAWDQLTSQLLGTE